MSDFTGPIEERDAVVAAEAVAERVAMGHHVRAAQHDLAVALREATHAWNAAAMAAALMGITVDATLESDGPALVVCLHTPA